MGLPWIQVQKEFARSPEAIALGSALGIGRHAAVGMCVEFWGWCSDNAKRAKLDGLGPMWWVVEGPLATLIIDEAVTWRGKKSFAEAMIDVGLLHRAEFGLLVSGSERYAKAFEKAERDASRKRERRANGAETARAVPHDVRAAGAGKSQIESQIQSQILPSEVVAPPTPKELQPGPRLVEAPTSPPETWTGHDFWRWAQSRRQDSGCVPEKQPHPSKLSSWWSAATLTPGVSVRALREAWFSFGDDPHWEQAKPPWPFAAFMSQWDKYTKPEATNGHAA